MTVPEFKKYVDYFYEYDSTRTWKERYGWR
jgi:hypothetical protein